MNCSTLSRSLSSSTSWKLKKLLVKIHTYVATIEVFVFIRSCRKYHINICAGGLTHENKHYYGYLPTICMYSIISILELHVCRVSVDTWKNVLDDLPTCARCSLVNQSYIPESTSLCYHLVFLPTRHQCSLAGCLWWDISTKRTNRIWNYGF